VLKNVEVAEEIAAMAIDNEATRIAQEENPGPSELESVLLQDSLKEIEVDPAMAMDETSSIYEAVRMMRQHRQPCVLVTREGKLTGIFTEHDVLIKVVDAGIDLEHTPVRYFMTPDPITLPADVGVAYALNKMVVDGLHRLPLVDAEGRPTGVVSMGNIIAYLSSFFPKEILNLPPEPAGSFRQREGA
jgi:CBS domain-containing protein